MIGRRAWLGGLLAMTFPGLGGQQPPPQNASPAGQLIPGVTPGVSGQIIARRVIIEGPNGGLLVYSSAPPVLGNLILSDGAGGFKDSAGNLVLQGSASYQQASATVFFAQANVGGDLVWYTASSPAGPWTQTAQMSVNTAGQLSLSLEGGTVTGSWPVAGGSSITTVAQVVTALEAMGLLTP